MRHPDVIAVVGAAAADPPVLAAAEEVGAALAEAGFTVVTGGLGGVMEAASRGARSKLGATIGILPGEDPDDANGWVGLAIPTGMGAARNALVVAAARACVAVGGEYGTLSEIALALRAGKAVVGLWTWDVQGVEQVSTPAEAAERIKVLLAESWHRSA
ncbi:MAG TPA: TIGR00725 family protein [Solirubrobacteraceae bacterium]|nr:TIGR00725 family protein [Solirubrobacteraceae bacterium]